MKTQDQDQREHTPRLPDVERARPVDRWQAFELYRQLRSTRAVAAAGGRPLRTVQDWSSADGWVEKVRQEDEEKRQDQRLMLMGMVSGGTLARIRAVDQMCFDPEVNPATRLSALKFMLGLDGVRDLAEKGRLRSPNGLTIEGSALIDEDDVIDLEALSEEELEERQRRRVQK